MIGQKNTKVFWHQSEARTGLTVWNWSVKTLSPGSLLRVLDFSSPEFFIARFRLFPVPTNCPWVSEDAFFFTFGFKWNQSRCTEIDFNFQFSLCSYQCYARGGGGPQDEVGTLNVTAHPTWGILANFEHKCWPREV